MSYESNQQAVRTAIEAARVAWTDYTLRVEYDNADAAQPVGSDPFLAVEMVYLGGGQLDLGKSPLVQDMGQIILLASVLNGAGNAKCLKLLEHFRPYLELKDTGLGAVRTHAAYLQKPREPRGLYVLPMIIGFWTQRAT